MLRGAMSMGVDSSVVELLRHVRAPFVLDLCETREKFKFKFNFFKKKKMAKQ